MFIIINNNINEINLIKAIYKSIVLTYITVAITKIIIIHILQLIISNQRMKYLSIEESQIIT